MHVPQAGAVPGQLRLTVTRPLLLTFESCAMPFQPVSSTPSVLVGSKYPRVGQAVTPSAFVEAWPVS